MYIVDTFESLRTIPLLYHRQDEASVNHNNVNTEYQ